MNHEVVVDAAKAAPPAGVVAAHLSGLSVPGIINWLTLIYVAGLCI
jgi:hypothetical protein